MEKSEKRRKIDIVTQNTSRASSAEIDWDKCFICQKNVKEKLQNPFNSAIRTADPKATYETLTNNIKLFQKIGQLPVSHIPIDKLEKGGQLNDELYEHKAKYHKSCKLKFSSSKLPKPPEDEPDILPDTPVIPTTSEPTFRQVRNSKRLLDTPTEEPLKKQEKCFFCDLPADSKSALHLVQSFRLDTRVRRCARLLNDFPLLAKLNSGNLITQDAMYHIF